MKTNLHLRQTGLASIFAVLVSLFLSLQAMGQTTCQAGFTFAVSTNTVTFTNTSTGGSQPVYYWNFGDGSNDWQTNPAHTYTSNGTYSACLIMYDSLNNGCQSTYCASIVISNAPTPPCNAAFVYYGDSANQNQGQFFDQSSNNPTSWSWTFGDGGTSTQQNPVHQYAQPGYYAVCLTITDASSQTCTHCDTISYFPCTLVAGFTSNSSNDPQISFTNTSTGGSAPFYSWNFGDGGYATGTNATHTYQYNGNYVVCLSAYDSLGSCSDYFCDTITISNAAVQPCVAQFYSYPDSNNTFSGTIQFYDYSTGGATSWSWTFGDGGTSTQQHPTHQYTTPGTYQVCLTITTASSTCSSCSTVTVNTNSAPCSASMYLVQDTANPSSLTWYAYTYITGTAPFTYVWDFGDGNTSTQQYPSHTYAQAGNYLICLTITDATGCTSSICDSTYKLMLSGSMLHLVAVNTTGVEENTISVISVFPNPANETIQVSFDQWEKGTLSVTDMTGRKVLAQDMNANNTKVNVADLPAGCYTLSIQTETKTGHSRIMIVR